MLYTGPDFAVVDKPAGLPSVPGRTPQLQDSIQTRVQRVFPNADGPISIHRLDMETSGLIVVAFNRETHRTLSRQFMHRKVGKSYIALLDGEVIGDEGAVDLPLAVDWPNRPRQIVNHTEGKPARTLWRVIAREPGRTRVRFRPMTGRTHQLRVHAAWPREHGGLGCPIAGDTIYGDPERAPRLMLHAESLAFWAPHTGEWLKFDSPAPF